MPIADISVCQRDVDVISRTPILVDRIGPIRDEPAATDEVAMGVHRRQSVLRRKGYDQIAMKRRSAQCHHQPAVRGARELCDRALYSETSGALIGLNSIPRDGATAWTTANWPIPRKPPFSNDFYFVEKSGVVGLENARAKLCNPYRAHPSRALVWTTLHVRVSVVQSELSERMLRLLACRSQVFV